jgi:translation elongation factor EF-Tu-like GTPase
MALLVSACVRVPVLSVSHMGHDPIVSDAPTFRFRVAEAFELTGRGTTVTSTIEQGMVAEGDRLRLVHGGQVRRVVCEGVTTIRSQLWKPRDPVPVALLVPTLDKEQITAGDVIEADL